MKRLFIFFLFTIAMLFFPSGVKRFTKGFKIAKIRLDFPDHPEWEVPLDPEIISLLKQPYFFLGKGAQCYVFASQDGKWVIKFFRYDRPISTLKILSVFNACKLAYDYLKEETGILYLHLNPTMLDLPVLCCKDPVGRKIKFDLNRCRFAFQKRAEPFRDTIEKESENPERMKKRIDEFIDLLIARTEKKILNLDPNLSRNFGFLEDRAIEIDFGNYQICDQMDQKAEIKRYADRLKRWLSSEGIDYLESRLKALE